MRNLKYTVSKRVADGNVDAVRNNALLKKSKNENVQNQTSFNS
jgi:hypothetical protein